MIDSPSYSVVIPCYNSSSSLIELYNRIVRVFERANETFEIIYVDDGSSETATWQTLKRLAASEHVLAVGLSRNFGKPNAVLCGIAEAAGAWIITIDDDLQQQPEDIPKLLALKDHDVVVGQILNKQHGPIVNLGSKIKAQFDRFILGIEIPMSPLKLIRAEIARSMLEMHATRPFIPALLATVTNDFVSVPIDHQPSQIKESRYTLRRRFSQFSNLLIGHSTLLLRGLAVTGTLTALTGFAFAIYTLVRRILGDVILPGWSSLIVINLVFGGLILLGLGLNGEYLLRISETASKKPRYIVRRKIKLEPGEGYKT